MFLEILKACYLDHYRLKLWFNNGDVRIADLKDSLIGQAFQPLRDIDFFKKFRINLNTVEWPNEVDFAPEYLYSISVSEGNISKPARKRKTGLDEALEDVKAGRVTH
ncbi:MAG: DUF2442 domain-containing protein [Muribaculaceae bacterium]|nr:DUF2442 domain-containing protein [Muribaculaceae bacterium]